VYLDWEALAGLFGTRGGREQMLSFLLIVTVTAICFFVGDIVNDHPVRWDLTEARLHSLDPKTEAILQDIPDGVEVEILGFFVSSFDSIKAAKRRAFERLVDAARATGTSARIEVIDPEMAPLIASQMGITSNATVIVTARTEGAADRTERLYSPDEQELANALLRVISGERPTIVFLEGHGERAPSMAGERGLSLLAGQLTTLGFGVGTWNSVTEPEPPTDMSVLVLAGPTHRLEAREASIIRQWVEDGGALMMLAEPELRDDSDGLTGLEGALLTWGFEFRDDLVIDPLMSRLGGDPAAPIADTFAFHEITQDFDLPVVFVTARSLVENNTLPEQVTTFDLARTSDGAWGETNLEADEIEYNEGEDFEGPMTLIGLAELHREGSEGQGRVVVAGDVDWLTNGLVVSRGNLDLASRTLGWLAREDDVVELPAREATADTMELSLLQLLLMVFISVFLVPGGTAVAAGIIFMWRRGL
jgi:hypothetical protein